MGRKKYHYIVVPGLGDPCPRCCQPTQIREHEAVTEAHLRAPYYYRRWFCCLNPQCRVTTHLADRYRVWNISGKEICSPPPRRARVAL
jgi:hypothetical protein